MITNSHPSDYIRAMPALLQIKLSGSDCVPSDEAMLLHTGMQRIRILPSCNFISS